MDDQWFYGKDGSQRGPVDLQALRALATSGELRPHDLIWRQGMADWVPASKMMPEMFVAAPAATSAPPPSPPYEPVAPPPPVDEPVVPPIGHPTPLYESNAQGSRAVMALVLGILSMPSCMCPLIGIPLAIAAIVLGAGVNPGPSKGLAIAGVICGAVGLLLNLPSAGHWMRHW